MAKKEQKKAQKKEQAQSEQAPGMENLPPEVKKKLEQIQKKLDKFKDEALKKFDEYIKGIMVLPPPAGKDGKQEQTENVHLLIAVDDSDSKKMSKFELKDKLTSILSEMAKKTDENFQIEVMLLSEFWQSCYDAKHDLQQLIALGAPVYDTGVLSAIKLGEVHKSMVLKKFEKYIVSYVLWGSLTRGEAKPESDIDVAIIVDDTDVKKMTRAELKDKLRAIIIGMGMEASQITGIKKAFNIQVWILTEFWDGIKEANPVFFTSLRDGVPFYDRGMFMPWKQLLKMGRIKPSRESIDMFMSTGEQMVGRVRRKLLELVEADIYWSTLTPTQAALMMYGIAPPTPKETLQLVEDIFVKKEKLLEKKYLDTLKLIRQYYKKLEHGELKKVSGKEVDDLINKAEDYLKRLKKLFGEIEVIKQKESMTDLYDNMVTVVRDILKQEGIESVTEKDLQGELERHLVNTGKLPAKAKTLLKNVTKAHTDFTKGKLTKVSVENAKKDYKELVNMLVENMQRGRARELERAKIRVKYGEKYGEVILFDDMAFIIHDVDAKEKEIHKATIKDDGSLGRRAEATIEELEAQLAKMQLPPSVFIKAPVFESLKDIFGKDAEVLVNRA